jgi:acyl-CoA synthetase (NDP forming)
MSAAPATAAGRDLRALFAPASVAVVGASDDPAKWGNWLARGALRGEGRRAVHLVNRRGGEVLGRPAHRSLAELPEAPELVVLAVPPATVDRCVDDAISIGARAIVAITAGAADGDAGGPRDAALAARVRAAGAVLVGPNCLGVYDAASELELVAAELPAGPIGLVTQSGNVGLEVGLLAAEAGLGFSRFVSLGNQADLAATELIADLAAHPATELIAVYVEDFRDGRAFAAAAHAARAAGTPVVLLAIERTDATARAVRSHTGALASDAAAIEAACRAAGIARARTPQELIDLADGLLRAPAPAGRRVAVLADGGGHGGIAAGLAGDAGLDLPVLSAPAVARLRAELPPTAAAANPVDLAGGGEQDIRSFERAARVLLECGEVDALLVSGYFGGYAEYGAAMGAGEAAVAQALGDVVRATGRPLVVHSMYAGTPAARTLRRAGVPVFGAVERAVAVLARLAAAAEAAPGGVPALPDRAPPVAAGAGYAEARALLAAAGVPFAAAEIVAGADPDAAAAAAARIGWPVALKALGTLHKSDAGGVVLGVSGESALRAAVADLAARLDPPALSVERMAPVADGAELLIGARRDPRFGPVALAGLGGVHAEVMRDVAVALAPVTPAEAERMLLSLRAAPLLRGARGRAALDVGAAARALSALSHVAAAHPELAELEVNPLLVLPSGALALDARFVAPQPDQESE